MPNTFSPAHRARWLASFLDNIPAAVYRTTVEGRIIYCNRAAAKLFGCDSVNELLGSSVAGLYQDMRARGYLVQGVLINFEVQDLLLPQLKKDGSPIWCRVGARAVLDDEGAVEFIDEWVRDVTGEIGEAEADATYLRLINAANSFVIFFDLDGRILDMDLAGYESLGFEKLQILGHPLRRFVPADEMEKVDDFFSDVLSKGEADQKIQIQDASGEERHLSMKAFLKHKGGQQDHVVCIARDVNRGDSGDDDVAHASKLEGVLEMAGGVSHRLNQPLMSITSLVQDLLRTMNRQDPSYSKLLALEEQITELNAIAKKISGIVKYESTDYVWGLRIVDIDKASGNEE